MPADLIVFDLDGTLLDTHADLVDSLNHTVAPHGLAPLTYADLTHLVGSGAKAMIERAFALRKAMLRPEEVPGLLERFIEHYRGNMPGKTTAFPGLVDALDRLEAEGYRFAVCTNKLEELALPLLEGLGLAGRFAAVTGGNSFSVRKPDAGHLLGTIERAGGTRTRSVMVGDSVNDIMAARNAAVASIVVPFGYSDVPVESLGADRIIGHYDELTAQLVEDVLSQN